MDEERKALYAELDGLTRRTLWFVEAGRCYCCGVPATDTAHLFSRRILGIRWETGPWGNVHLLCRECHDLDHKGLLVPSYKEVAEERFKKHDGRAWTMLMYRYRQNARMVNDDLRAMVKSRTRLLYKARQQAFRIAGSRSRKA